MERCGDHSAFKENVCIAIGQLGDARILTRRLRLEVLGMDCLTTAPEVENAIRGELGDKMNGQLRVSLLAVNSREQIMAVVEIDEMPGRTLIENGKLRVRWIICRVRESALMSKGVSVVWKMATKRRHAKAQKKPLHVKKAQGARQEMDRKMPITCPGRERARPSGMLRLRQSLG
ncbi:PREDICTED: uncharacterized protein LOC108361931 [Rhagoletis zephyria]|uniref:uncharacterized protein LOC108361931 n=1 Tax=Rhagoletis zephyria TaxID=28612 RepID=UPI00081158BF|nr:PREDICTED: uncharacterized protein LOC108361931 [Rhagoletis zephyria]